MGEKVCNRCKGTGYVEHYNHVVGGVCFKCYGTGGTDKEEIEHAKIMFTGNGARKVTVEEEIEGLKEGIASIYNKLTYPATSLGKLTSVQKTRREIAKAYYKELKETHGIVMTLEEIQAIAKQLREDEENEII